MIRGLLLALLLAPITATALDLRLGLAYSADPLYNGVYYDKRAAGYTYPDDGIVGKIELSQRFSIDEHVGINIFATHYSYLYYADPHFGINLLGAELEFRFGK